MKIRAALLALAMVSPALVFASQNAPYAVEATTRAGSKLLSLDFESAGDVSAFTFRVALPEGVKRIDTSSCLSDLPKGFTGVCNSRDNFVAVTVYSNSGKSAPAGLFSVGKISYSGGGVGQVKIDVFEASISDGKEASIGTAKVEKLD